MIGIVLVLILFVSVALIFVIGKSQSNLHLSRIPSPKKHPLFHNAWVFRSLSPDSLIDGLEKWKQQLGSVYHFTFYPFHRGLIFVSDPKIVDQLLLEISDPVKQSSYRFLKRWLGDGLFSTTGAAYEKRLKIISCAFNTASMNHLMTKMNKYSGKFIDILKGNLDTNIVVSDMLKNLPLDVFYGTV
jgi:cytochrome P450 family 4